MYIAFDSHLHIEKYLALATTAKRKKANIHLGK